LPALALAYLTASMVAACDITDTGGPPSTTDLAIEDAVQLVEADGFMDPTWSLDGTAVSFSGERYRGLYSVPAAGGTATVVASEHAVSGFRHRWIDADDGPAILCPARGRKPAVQVVVAMAELRELVVAPIEPVFARDDALFVRGPDGEQPLSDGQDRFFDEILSPTGEHVAAVGLRNGIHVFDAATGELVAVAEGTHPAWTPDGRWVLFEWTVDDGYRVLVSDLWALSVEDGRAFPLTATSDVLEGQPSVSPDGTAVAYVADGAVHRARLVEVTR